MIRASKMSRYVLVGEEIEFNDEGAEVLLAKGVIEPAKGGRAIKKSYMEVESNGSDVESN